MGKIVTFPFLKYLMSIPKTEWALLVDGKTLLPLSILVFTPCFSKKLIVSLTPKTDNVDKRKFPFFPKPLINSLG